MSAYCFKCCSTLDTYRIDFGDKETKPWCHACDQEAIRVRCLVCLDSGEVSALGEERECPRGCKSSTIPLDSESGEGYTLEDAKGDE